MAPFKVRHSRVNAKNAKKDEKRSAILKSLAELAAKLQSIESTDEKEIRQIDQVIFPKQVLIIPKDNLLKSASENQAPGCWEYLIIQL